MFAKGQTVIQFLEQLAPKYLAVPDDRIGLQLGSLQKEIRKVLVALDVTLEVVEEAVREQADLIIAHHAIIFRPLAHLQTDSPAGRLYEKLIKNDVAVYIAHTNLDSAEGGINDWLAEPLNFTDVKVLEEVYKDAEGHSYGLGRTGRLAEPVSLADLAERVKAAFGLPAVRLVGDPLRSIRKAAVLGGAGGKYVRHALFAGADVLITGDIDYHTAHDAAAAGLAIIDAGHNIEKIMKPRVADYLNGQFAAKRYETRAVPSVLSTEIFRFV